MDMTTIKVSKTTKVRLDKLKQYKKESYDEILNKVLLVINLLRINPIKARKLLRRIEFLIIKDGKEKFYEEKLLKQLEDEEAGDETFIQEEEQNPAQNRHEQEKRIRPNPNFIPSRISQFKPVKKLRPAKF